MSTRDSLVWALRTGRRLAAWAQENGFAPRDGLSALDGMALFDSVVEHQQVRLAARQLYEDGHYALAVQQACIALNSAVRSKSGSAKDGADLMFAVFSDTNPILRLNRCATESQKNEQAGYQQIMAGVMRGVRNPRSHEVPYVDDPDTALRLLGLIDHLHRKVDLAKRVPQKRQ